jgi:hypothetical protein
VETGDRRPTTAGQMGAYRPVTDRGLYEMRPLTRFGECWSPNLAWAFGPLTCVRRPPRRAGVVARWLPCQGLAMAGWRSLSMDDIRTARQRILNTVEMP